jgi:hypothetical protein
LVKRRKRDMYGNWVWEDDEDIRLPDEKRSSSDDLQDRRASSSSYPKRDEKDSEEISLDWRDFVALSIASLETFLLPIVIFILILIGIVLGLSFFH